jgi:uncharacterized protein
MTDSMPPEFWQAVEQFNQRQFYDCHDTLEALWLEEVDPLRRFYQGILQIAVACYHLSRHNWRGAMILLGEGMSRLRDYQPNYGGVEVTPLLMQSQALLTRLQQTDPAILAGLTQPFQPEVEVGTSAAIATDTPPLPIPTLQLVSDAA